MAATLVLCRSPETITIGAFDRRFKPQIRDHVECFPGRLSAGCEVPGYEDGIYHIKRQRLERTEMILSSAGSTNLTIRIEKTRKTERF
jgi:hypothetical protein